MGNKLREFLNFVQEITGSYPEKWADSFRDIFIYIPKDKTPPNTNDSSNPKRAISIIRFFSNRNSNFCDLVYNDDWNELEDHLGSDLLRFCLTECILAKRTKGGSFMVSNLLNLRNKITVDPIPELDETFFKTGTYNEDRQSLQDRKSAEAVVSMSQVNLNQPAGVNEIPQKATRKPRLRRSKKKRRQLAKAAALGTPQINSNQPPEVNEMFSKTDTCDEGIPKDRQSHQDKKSAEVVSMSQVNSNQPAELNGIHPKITKRHQRQRIKLEIKKLLTQVPVVSTPQINLKQPPEPNEIFSKTDTSNRESQSHGERTSAEVVGSTPQTDSGQPAELNEILSKTATCNQGISKEGNSRGRKRPAEVSLITSKVNLDHLFCPTAMEYTTDDVLPRISRTERLSCGYLRTEDDIGMKLSAQVLQTRVGNYQIFGYQSCRSKLEQLLVRFKGSDSGYNYAKVLNGLVLEEERKQNRQDKDPGNHLSSTVLRKYFEIILLCVIPESLIGGRNNMKQLEDITCGLLEITKHQSLSLQPYIQNMEISEVLWLNSVRNINVQWCILGKLLKWIMDRFILEIFRNQIYIATPNSFQKLFFDQDHFQQQTNELLRKMRKDKVIVCTNGLNTNVYGDGRLIPLRTENGVKPTIAPINKPGRVTRTALCYLQQLYATQYGSSGKDIFLEKWRNLVQNFQNVNNKNKTRFFVRCSVKNAYESVDQRKLVGIVELLANSTGSEPKLRYYKIARNLEAVKSNCFEWKKYFAYPELELPIASESIFACRPGKLVKVSKEVLLFEIKRNILNQNIRISNKRYLLQEGIVEGATMSSVLCDMYYAHMEEANLSQFRVEGFLVRHMGDFLFVTEDEALAERFLQHIRKGFPEYNCSFHAADIISNAIDPKQRLIPIAYLGFKLNPRTLEIVTEYFDGQRSTMKLPKLCCKPIETFREKLLDLSALDIDGILDCRINGPRTIINNLICIFLVQADRCMWLVNALFDNIRSQLTEIFAIIKSTNLQIIRHVERHFFANGYDFGKFAPQLAIIPWRCYSQIFEKNLVCHVYFQRLFVEISPTRPRPKSKKGAGAIISRLLTSI